MLTKQKHFTEMIFARVRQMLNVTIKPPEENILSRDIIAPGLVSLTILHFVHPSRLLPSL